MRGTSHGLGGVLVSDKNTLIIDAVEYSKPRPFQSDDTEENDNQQSVEAKVLDDVIMMSLTPPSR